MMHYLFTNIRSKNKHPRLPSGGGCWFRHILKQEPYFYGYGTVM